MIFYVQIDLSSAFNSLRLRVRRDNGARLLSAESII